MLKPNYSSYTVDNHLLKTIVILIDTREQENKHITDYLEQRGLTYKSLKLDYGDYSLMLPKNEEYGIAYDMRLDFAVERKHNLEEVSGNFSKERNRIEEELWRGNGKMFVLIEDGSLEKIIKHDYKTDYNEKSFRATIWSFNHRYNVPFYFVEKEYSPMVILEILIYKLREMLK